MNGSFEIITLLIENWQSFDESRQVYYPNLPVDTPPNPFKVEFGRRQWRLSMTNVYIAGAYESEIEIMETEWAAEQSNVQALIQNDPLYGNFTNVPEIDSLFFVATLEEAPPPDAIVVVIGYRTGGGTSGGTGGSGGGGGEFQESEAQAGEPDGASVARRMYGAMTLAQKQKIITTLSKIGFSDALIQKLMSQINSPRTMFAFLRVGDPIIMPNTNPPIVILTVSQYQNLNFAIGSLYTPESAQALTMLHNARATGRIIVQGR